MRFGRRWFLSGAAYAASPAPKSFAARFDGLGLYNVHEHLIPERERVSQPVDFFTLAGHYALNDVISAGLAGDALKTVRDPNAPLEKRWQAFEPHWRAAQFTGYGQALRTAVADIYDEREISAASIRRINEAIAKRNKPGLYDYVLRDRARIDWCLVDAYWNRKPARLDKPYFLLSQRFDHFITPGSRKDLADLEAISGVSIASLADLRKALEATFAQALEAGMAAVKCGLAYRRDLLFQETPERDAAAEFEALAKGGPGPFRKLQDHMFHHVAALAEDRRVPFQIHTGLPAGNAGYIERMRPTLLTNVFQRYPRVKFDILHLGYPYQREMGVLAKLFPNVYADFTWAHIISPVESRNTLDEYLETVPVDKILGFGGDYRYPELTYAHAKMARNIVAQVLAGKIASGLFTEEQAWQTGRMLLRENAVSVFGVKPN